MNVLQIVGQKVLNRISYYSQKIHKYYREIQKKIKRVLFANNITIDQNSIPIIINNFNRLDCLKILLNRLEELGLKNIIILDNDSTYPPLLDFYSETSHRVVYLRKNLGYMALWKSDFFKEVENTYYVYTDPDVVPVEDCPQNFLAHLQGLLKKYPKYEKIGLGLKIDDLPDFYANKEKVIAWESGFWKKELEPGVFDAHVDTTLALYRPFAQGNAEECPAMRTGGIYMARHLPWYADTKNPSEEDVYYTNLISPGITMWSKLNK